MPVPKRKTSRRRRDQRQSTKFIRPQAITSCKQCQEPALPHQVCVECGYYKGRKIMITKADRGLQRKQLRDAAAQKAQASQKHADDHGDHDHSDHK